jgi:hypothetical protein
MKYYDLLFSPEYKYVNCSVRNLASSFQALFIVLLIYETLAFIILGPRIYKDFGARGTHWMFSPFYAATLVLIAVLPLKVIITRRKLNSIERSGYSLKELNQKTSGFTRGNFSEGETKELLAAFRRFPKVVSREFVSEISRRDGEADVSRLLKEISRADRMSWENFDRIERDLRDACWRARLPIWVLEETDLHMPLWELKHIKTQIEHSRGIP